MCVCVAGPYRCCVCVAGPYRCVCVCVAGPYRCVCVCVLQDPIDVVVGEPGPLTLSLLSFVQEMNRTGNRTTVTPNVLFGNICKQSVTSLYK